MTLYFLINSQLVVIWYICFFVAAPLVEEDKETDEGNFLLWRLEKGIAEGSAEIPKGVAPFILVNFVCHVKELLLSEQLSHNHFPHAECIITSLFLISRLKNSISISNALNPCFSSSGIWLSSFL